MGAVLFIHPDRSFRERVRAEAVHSSHENILLSESLRASSKAILDPVIPLTAIFVSVKRLDFSLLETIEQMIRLRPVTPVYLLDHEMNPGVQSISVSGSFDSQATLSNLLGGLQSQKANHPETMKRMAPPKQDAREGMFAVPLVDFLELPTYPYDAYAIHPDGGVIQAGIKGTPVDSYHLRKLSRKVAFLHLRKEDFSGPLTALREARNQYQESPWISPEWKSSELLLDAGRILKGLRADLISDPTVEDALFFLGRLLTYLEQLDQSGFPDLIRRFLFLAGQSDRTLLTLAIAVLYCSRMKIQRSTTIQILGIACLLQDVSLFQSPFGNLAETNPKDLTIEQHAYYSTHPLASADLVAAHTSLPDVVIQVIRQHHERRDRTGFPNRVGGVQIHPLAEVLSLVNLSLDTLESAQDPSDFSRKLLAEVLPHYSESAVLPLLQIVEEFSFTKGAGSV